MMPITDIYSAKTQVAMVFDQLHVDSFTVSIPRTDDPKRTVTLQVGSYGVSESGSRIYAPDYFDATIPDFNTALIEDYCVRRQVSPREAVGRLLHHREVLKQSLADGTIDEIYLMAAFELAVRKVVEMSGAFDLTDIG